MPEKPVLYLAGPPGRGLPAFEDLIEMARRISGREPTPEEIADARALYGSRGVRTAAETDAAQG